MAARASRLQTKSRPVVHPLNSPAAAPLCYSASGCQPQGSGGHWWGPSHLAEANLLYLALIRWDRGYATISSRYVDLGILTVLLHFRVASSHSPPSCCSMSSSEGFFRADNVSMAAGQLVVCPDGLAKGRGCGALHAEALSPSRASGHMSIRRITPLAISLGVLQAAILFLTAYFVTTLSERIQSNERRLSNGRRALADRQLWSEPRTTGTGLRVLDQIDCTGPASAGKNGLPPGLRRLPGATPLVRRFPRRASACRMATSA